jgi:hypothetical protein
VGHFPGGRVDAPPELDKRLGGIRRDGGIPQRVVASVHEVGHARQFPDLAQDVGQVVIVRGGAVLAKPRGPRLIGDVAVFPHAGEEGPLQQVVVLQEAHEHTTEHPADGGLRQLPIPPHGIGKRGAPGVLACLYCALSRASSSGRALH